MSDTAAGQEDQQPKPNGVEEENAGGEKATASERPGGKKRMVAAFIAFVGAGYSGMQYNPGVKTIEGELCKAMCRAGCITTQNAKDPAKVSWQRAARTDKGVSAAGSVVSLKLMVDFPDVVERINAELPDQAALQACTPLQQHHCVQRTAHVTIADVDQSPPNANATAFDILIRVLGYTRVTKGFEARRLCDQRRYEYILPAFAFDPTCCRGQDALPVHVGAAGNIVEKHAGEELDLEAALKALPAAGQPEMQPGRAADGDTCNPSLSTAAPGASQTNATQINAGSRPNGAPQVRPQQDSSSSAAGQQQGQIKQHCASTAGGSGQQAETRPAADSSQAGTKRGGEQVPEHYRHVKFTAEQQARLNLVLSAYEGTHNFHNYTVRVAPDDPSAKRYILSFKCEGTMDIQGQQWVRMVVLGQSFMLHQIRKMVGTAVAVMREDAPPECISLALQPKRSVVTPMAPELGLFLDECIFESYNIRWGEDREARVALSDFQEQADAFKRDKIYPHIERHDAQYGINAAWLRHLTDTNFKFTKWGSAKAVRVNVERGAALLAMSELRAGPMQPGGNPSQKRKAGEALGNGDTAGHGDSAGNGRPARSRGCFLSEERRNEILGAELSE